MATSTTLSRYSPSGFFRPTTFALFLVLTAGAALGAWVYQLAMHWIPLIYLNALICGGFGFALGVAASWAIKTGHCRNRVIALIMTVPLVAAGLGGSFYWEYRRVLGDILEEAQKENPQVTAEDVRKEITFEKFIDLKVEAGWTVSNHGSGGSKMNGGMVWVIWGIEALVLLVIAVVVAWGAVNEPYCERCNQWGNERKMMLPGLARSDADALISSGDLDGVIGLPLPPEPDAQRALALTATLCPQCKDTGFLTVEEKIVVSRKKGKPQEKTTLLIKHAVLRADQRARFLERLEPGAAPPAAAAAL